MITDDGLSRCGSCGSCGSCGAPVRRCAGGATQAAQAHTETSGVMRDTNDTITACLILAVLFLASVLYVAAAFAR
jgi:hypothetical protein